MKLIVFLLLPLVLISCNVNPSEINQTYAKNFVNKMTYAKDERTGLCFGMVASRKTGNTDQNGLGFTMVPCDKVKHLIKEN